MSELEWDCNFLTVEVKPSAILASKSSSSGKLFSVVQMLQQLLAELKMHVKAAQDDMKFASRNAPGHGRGPVVTGYMTSLLNDDNVFIICLLWVVLMLCWLL